MSDTRGVLGCGDGQVTAPLALPSSTPTSGAHPTAPQIPLGRLSPRPRPLGGCGRVQCHGGANERLEGFFIDLRPHGYRWQAWFLVLSSWLWSLARHLEDGRQPAVRDQALGGVACRRCEKKYEKPRSTPVAAAQPHAAGPSPTARCAISAEPRLMAKPA